MDTHECERLLADIGSFLGLDRGERTSREQCRDFWQSRPVISADEIAMFRMLMDGPRCVGELAQFLGRSTEATGELLEAMAGIGLVERVDGEYANTAAMRMYCEGLPEEL